MKCPYCGKEDFIPEVVYQHTESYGGGFKRFRCLHCEEVVKVFCSLRVIVVDPQKTKDESDWG